MFDRLFEVMRFAVALNRCYGLIWWVKSTVGKRVLKSPPSEGSRVAGQAHLYLSKLRGSLT